MPVTALRLRGCTTPFEDENRGREILQQVIARHPLLGYRFTERFGRRAAWNRLPGRGLYLDPIPDRPGISPPLICVQNRGGTELTPLITHMEAALNTIPGGNAPWLWQLTQILYADCPDTLDLVLHGHHAIMDAHACWIVLQEWLGAMTGATLPPAAADRNNCRAGSRFRRGGQKPPPPEAICSAHAATTEQRRSRVLTTSLPHELTRRLQRLSRKHQARLSGVFQAALLQAIAANVKLPKPEVTIRFSTSERPVGRSAWHNVACLATGSVHSTHRPADEFWSLATEIHQRQMQRSREHVSRLQHPILSIFPSPLALSRGLVRRLLKPGSRWTAADGRMSILNVTNLGPLPALLPVRELNIETIAGGVSQHIASANFNALFTLWKRTWQITLIYVAPLYISDAATQIMRDFRKRLHQIASETDDN